MKTILTGNYEKCKIGNIISISKDGGEKANFNGLSLIKLKPKHDLEDFNKLDDSSKKDDYIRQYYVDVLSKIDPQDLLDTLLNDTILVDYDDKIFRHLVAFWFELFLDIKTYEVEVNPKRETIKVVNRPDYLKEKLEKIIKEDYNLNGYESISAAYLYNKSKEKEEEYKLTLKK